MNETDIITCLLFKEIYAAIKLKNEEALASLKNDFKNDFKIKEITDYFFKGMINKPILTTGVNYETKNYIIGLAIYEKYEKNDEILDLINRSIFFFKNSFNPQYNLNKAF